MRTSDAYDCKVGPLGSPSRDCIIDEEDGIDRVGMPESVLVDEWMEIQLDEWEDVFDIQLPKYKPDESERLKYHQIILQGGDCIRCEKSGELF